MPPFNRFAPSKYRNQLLEPHKLDKTFTELPATTPAVAPNGRTIDCGDECLAVSLGLNSHKQQLSLGNAVGLIDWTEPGKFGGKIEKVEVGGPVADLVWSGIETKCLGVVASSTVESY
jgi:hypothetical protein